MSYIVYLATNKVNGRCYVGQTSSTLARRSGDHNRDSKRGSKTPFHCALRKYGEENFDWSVIDTAETRAEILQKEIEHIAARKNLYNLQPGGEGIPKGFVFSEEARNNMNIALKSSWENNPERRARLAEQSRARWANPETKRLQSLRIKEGTTAAWAGNEERRKLHSSRMTDFNNNRKAT